MKAEAFQCDVSDSGAVTKVLEEIDKGMGPISGLITNAGASPPSSPARSTLTSHTA